MLSRLLFVRLKAAENALRDGRLDEAYRLATAPDIREHRRGAAVLAGLTEQFLERARNHYRADRFTEALIDLDRAKAGGVLKEQVAEMIENVKTVAAEFERRQRSRRDRLDQAKRRIEGGSIIAGKKILEKASVNDLAAEALRKKADDRDQEAREIVAQADQLLGAGQMVAAVQRLRQARMIDSHDEAVTQLEARLCNQALENARAALMEGRIARAADEIGCLSDLGNKLPAKRELQNILATAQDTAQSVQDGKYAQARRHAMSLARLLPKAKWIDALAEQLRTIDELQDELLAGPMGDRVANGSIGASMKPPSPRRGKGGVSDETIALPDRVRSDAALPDRLLLLVDGGGSYLILRNDRASIGRAASSKPADIPLFSDVAETHASIARVDDDFFLFTSKEVEVAGKRTPHQLLQNGDRLVLGKKAKMTFRVPSRKSPSAILDMSDTTKMPNDVRRVVLFHQHASLGAGPASHIRCNHAGPSLVLFERNGALWIRQKGNGHVDTDAVQLNLGEPVEIAGASLALQPWEVRVPGTRTV